jgi:hypothetical protein
MNVVDLASGATESSNSLIGTSSGRVDVSGIIGWGSDADPRNDPTYPYRDRSQEDHSGEWKRPSLQDPHVEVLQSVEHKQLPAVFGESSPPRWASGMIRRAAFTWSESNWAHWLLLIGADRVNMIEGLVEDLARGTIPNIPREMGFRAEWQYNKRGLAAKMAIASSVAGSVYLWSRSRKARRSRISHDQLSS